MNTTFTIALAGNPNSGKTTLFNALTGSRQHVGNYPGVTVEKKEGVYAAGSLRAKIVDLPGTYSLSAYSVEEVVARDYLVTERPDAIVNIVDAANLERNLYLTCQFLELGVPMVIALNMIDVAKDRGIEIHAERLAELLGVPVVPIIARQGEGAAKLMEAAIALPADRCHWQPRRLSYGDDLDAVLLEMEEMIADCGLLSTVYPTRWTAIKLLEGDEKVQAQAVQADAECAGRLIAMTKKITDHLQLTVATYPEAMIADHRYGFIKSISKQGVIVHRFDRDRLYTSDRIDKVLTNRYLGPLVMVGVLFGLYQFTFSASELPVSWLGSFFDWLGNSAAAILPEGHLRSLIVSGIIDGVGGVLGFVPLILCMFFGLAFLEDSGYLARVAFMMDRVFRIFGLHGSSVMSYIVSGGIAGGCAVPGVMATRTLRSPKERMATLLTAPFMNCGAKVPVMALLIGIFFARHQAAFMMLFTLLAWVMALLVAKLLRLTLLRGEPTPFVMELPPYRMPTLRGLLIHTWERTWQYIKKAGTIILGFSIVIWAMMTFPQLPVEQTARYEAMRQEVLVGVGVADVAGQQKMPVVTGGSDEARHDKELTVSAEERAEQHKKLVAIAAAEAEAALKHSAAGRAGMAFEKVSWLAGFDWRTNIALVGGVAAKEIIISTLSTVYSLGEGSPEDSVSLAATLANDPAWNQVLALSLIVFIMFYSPCVATVICIVRESGSWKWGAFSVAFNSIFAFLCATLVYRVGLLFG